MLHIEFMKFCQNHWYLAVSYFRGTGSRKVRSEQRYGSGAKNKQTNKLT
jgi:hypothetical protein